MLGLRRRLCRRRSSLPATVQLCCVTKLFVISTSEEVVGHRYSVSHRFAMDGGGNLTNYPTNMRQTVHNYYEKRGASESYVAWKLLICKESGSLRSKRSVVRIHSGVPNLLRKISHLPGIRKNRTPERPLAKGRFFDDSDQQLTSAGMRSCLARMEWLLQDRQTDSGKPTERAGATDGS